MEGTEGERGKPTNSTICETYSCAPFTGNSTLSRRDKTGGERESRDGEEGRGRKKEKSCADMEFAI